MRDQKRKRMVAAITVNVVLLIAILVAVLIYQWVTMSILAGRRAALREEIEKYKELKEQYDSDLEYLSSSQNLLDLALQYGYEFPED